MDRISSRAFVCASVIESQGAKGRSGGPLLKNEAALLLIGAQISEGAHSSQQHSHPGNAGALLLSSLINDRSL